MNIKEFRVYKYVAMWLLEAYFLTTRNAYRLRCHICT